MGLLARIFGADRPPVEARTNLDPDERITAWGTTALGDAIIATPRGLWLPAGSPPAEPAAGVEPPAVAEPAVDARPANAELSVDAVPTAGAGPTAAAEPSAGVEPAVVARPADAEPAAEAAPVADAGPAGVEPAMSDGEGYRRRLPWHEIHKATWNDGLLTITPGIEVEPGVVADGPPLRIRLAEPRELPAEVRRRVTRSVASSTRHALPDGGVTIVARRQAGIDGLTWVLRFDEGTDRADPEVRQRAAELIAEAQSGDD